MVVNVVSDLAKNHPQVIQAIMQNAAKFVPQTVVNSGGNSTGLEGAAAIFGTLMKSSTPEQDARRPAGH
jgi:hypothetical protein